MNGRPIDLDIKKSTRFSSNLWALGILLVSVIGAYAAWRDLRDSDKAQVQEIVQTQTVANERYLRQEHHFEYSDARLNKLEEKAAAGDVVIQKILTNVEWLVEDRKRKNQQ